MDTSKVGFYLSAHMGLTFNLETLQNLYKCYKQFKNSVCLSYDISKANFGLNPIHAFRLSEKTIQTLEKEIGSALATDKISLA